VTKRGGAHDDAARPGRFEETVLLAVARLDGDGYGLSILREIEERAGERPAIGAVYATLERLEAKGWIRSSMGDATPVRGGRARRLYSLEPTGARALRDARRAFDRLWDGLELKPRRGAEAR
jgi:DNA-binding PadR family transcriptional regulator